jgi:drug/metabolite transporter (DMT)-like permease
LVSILYYFAFDEKLKKIEFVGILLVIVSIILIAFSKSGNSSISKIHPIWPILCVFVCLIWMIIMYALIKWDINRIEVKPNTYFYRNLYNCVWSMLVLAASVIYWSIFGIEWYYFLIGSMGGILLTIGGTMVVLATVHARGGPSFAIIETSCLFQTLFDMIFLGQVPNLMEVLGLCIGFGATVVIILGEGVIKKVRQVMKSDEIGSEEEIDET